MYLFSVVPLFPPHKEFVSIRADSLFPPGVSASPRDRSPVSAAQCLSFRVSPVLRGSVPSVSHRVPIRG